MATKKINPVAIIIAKSFQTQVEIHLNKDRINKPMKPKTTDDVYRGEDKIYNLFSKWIDMLDHVVKAWTNFMHNGIANRKDGVDEFLKLSRQAFPDLDMQDVIVSLNETLVGCTGLTSPMRQLETILTKAKINLTKYITKKKGEKDAKKNN